MATQNAVDTSPTQYNVLTGSTNGKINNVAPSATVNYVLVSNGASAQPSFKVNAGAYQGGWVQYSYMGGL